MTTQNPECCVAGIATIRDELLEDLTLNMAMQGMVRKATDIVSRDATIGVHDLMERLAEDEVTFEDALGYLGEPIVFYRPEEERRSSVSTANVTGERLALAVATCATRCVGGTCVTLYPVNEQPVLVNEKGE